MKLKKPDFEIEDKILREHILFESALLSIMRDTKGAAKKLTALIVSDLFDLLRDIKPEMMTSPTAIMEYLDSRTESPFSNSLGKFLDETEEAMDRLKANQLDNIHRVYPVLERFDFQLMVEHTGGDDEPFSVKLINIVEVERADH